MKAIKRILLGASFGLAAGLAGAQTGQLVTLANFNGTNGWFPYGGMIVGSDGVLYGTTYEGGTNNTGALFRLTTDGTFTSFDPFPAYVSDAGRSVNGTGGYPYAGLALGADGGLYGVASSGGTNATGTFFRTTTNGVLAVPFTFANLGTNAAGSTVDTNTTGAAPEGRLVLAADGNFYGTSHGGGSQGKGTVFRLTTNGIFTKLVELNGTNGANPEAGLTAGGDGNFYGVTYFGGANNNGSIFRITTNGSLASLYSFSALVATAGFAYTNADGANPAGDLRLGGDGLLYGTCHGGGTYGYGMVFKVTTSGQFTPLVSFNTTNGAYPLGALTVGPNGNLYGVTPGGGTNVVGVIYELTPAGSLNLLFSFDPVVSNGSTLTNGTGAYPYAPLTLAPDGSFYGTTTSGGAGGRGTVFRFTMASTPPRLQIQPLAGAVVLRWTNAAFSLQSAPQVAGTFSTVSGATSPYTNPITGNRQFFRLLGN